MGEINAVLDERVAVSPTYRPIRGQSEMKNAVLVVTNL
jgi:hypothetical protein